MICEICKVNNAIETNEYGQDLCELCFINNHHTNNIKFDNYLSEDNDIIDDKNLLYKYEDNYATINSQNIDAYFSDKYMDSNVDTAVNIKNLVCTGCNRSFDDFSEIGLLGCANCYQIYKDRLLPIIKSMQMGTFHNGKVLLRDDFDSAEIKGLEFKLRQAVASENYELASQIKKQIIDLRYLKEDSGYDK